MKDAAYQGANQIRIDDYERDLIFINLPIVFMMENCSMSWADRRKCADAMLSNNRAYTGMAKEREMMKEDRTAGAQESTAARRANERS